MRHSRHYTTLGAAIAVALGVAAVPAAAQQDDESSSSGASGPGIQAPTIERAPQGEIEEVITVGRSLSGTQGLINERLDDEVVVDVLGAEAIGRLGDSNVAVALRRVPGLSLVQDRFIYIRGLGERYSASMLNGAFIPSPDLTRNVIPLDIFPTAIVDSLRVQKAYSADMPANFGGGSVDIRTKGIPDNFTFLLEAGSGLNSANSGNVLTYAGGGDDRYGTDDGSRALSQTILEQINRFRATPASRGS